MYCSQCGKEVREGSRFCGNCGVQVKAATDGADAALATLRDGEAPPSEDAARNSRLSVIAAGVAGIAVIAALLLFATQCAQPGRQQPAHEVAQGAQTETSSESTSSTESPSAKLDVSPEEEFIKSLDGWWTHGARQGVYGDNLSHLHDGTIDTYTAAGEFVQTFRTITTYDVERFDNGLGADGVMGPGWFIYGMDKSEDGMYVSDAQPDAISMVHIDGTGYSGGDTLVRVDAPEWADKAVGAAGDGGKQEPASHDATQASEILEGWWVDQGTGAYIKHITGGKVREYGMLDNGTCYGGDKAVDVVAERVDEPPALGMADGPGWALKLMGPDNSLVHFLADSDSETLYCAASDGAAHPESYLVRTKPSDALASYAASMEDGSVDAPQAGEGEVVFTGTVVSTTLEQRQRDLGLPDTTGFTGNSAQLVLLQLDAEQQVNAMNGDRIGYSTRPVTSVRLGSQWASRSGERATVAVSSESLIWPSDVGGALVSIYVQDDNVREL